MIVDGENFFLQAPPVEVSRFLEYQVHQLPGLHRGQADAVLSPGTARVDQVVETDPVYTLLFHEMEDVFHLMAVVTGEGESEAHLDAGFPAVANGCQAFLEGAPHSPKPVMNLTQAIQADPHVGNAGRFDVPRHLPGDHGAIGGNDYSEPLAGGIAGQFQRVLAI